MPTADGSVDAFQAQDLQYYSDREPRFETIEVSTLGAATPPSSGNGVDNRTFNTGLEKI